MNKETVRHQPPRVVTVTPAIAQRWLEDADRAGSNFRLLKSHRVSELAADIRVNGWKYDGNAFKFNTAGLLIDGQHRASAIVKLNVTVEAIVVEGIDDLDAMTIDTGERRTINQYFRAAKEQHADVLSSALRYLCLHRAGKLHLGASSERQFTIEHLRRTLERYPEVRDSVVVAAPLKRIGAVAGQVALLHYLATNAGLEDEAGRFVTSLRDGTGLEANDPIYRLRERLRNSRQSAAVLQALDKFALTIKAWNHWLHGRPCRVLIWRALGPRGEPFPDILLSVPSDAAETPEHRAP